MQVDKLFVAAKAFIVRDDKVLILREAPTKKSGTNIGWYQLPGGRIEPHESFEQGLRRETLEECGLKIQTIGSPIDVHDWWPKVKNEQWHIVGIFVKCNPELGEIVLSEEHDEHAWIDPKQHYDWKIVEDEHAVFEAYLKLLER
jgi:8-oxo-dGTP pyrophosphatase MutT (NUDIX family)